MEPKTEITEDIYEKISMKKIILQFAKNTTAHGITQIALARGRWFKLFWVTAIIGCQIGIYLQITPLVIQYRKRPVVTKVYQIADAVLTFPVVTVCNINPIRKTEAEMLFNDTDGGLNASNSLRTGQFFPMKDLWLSSISFKLGNQMLNYGHLFENFVLDCRWNFFHSCMNSRFWKQFWHWKYGNCFSFNSGYDRNNKAVPVLTSFETNINTLLSLELNIGLKDYYLPLAKRAGIILHVGEQDVMKDILSHSHYLSPGFSHLISMEKTIRKRADPFNNRTCIPHYKTDLGKQPNNDQRILKKYSRKTCMDLCSYQVMIRKCNCTPYWAPSLNSKRRCHSSDEACVLAVDYDYMHNNLSCLRECRFPCEEINHLLSISSAKFPLNETESSEKNRLEVYFSFKKPETVVMEDEEYYMIHNLLSDIGGQLGLWSGVSVLTLVELLVLCAYGTSIIFQKVFFWIKNE
ncbi:FMRFamide-activated amiloride-sensitive sodium channel-like [Hydractinia symbiolongicarpus]|uniref:FMRFamide-activated amiloride-sensitive sodium channel-like n=1 Tax=Hydractinia symbiolongicarpus TaxID=13093 RepID=UPI00254BCD15|nr:FMRFamide-activated amiloride-sensitive sodium channel-like [Hydractinia symbiolongicarpus]